MTPQQNILFLGLLERLTDLIDREYGFYFKERPFLENGGKVVFVQLTEDEERDKKQIVRERVIVAHTIRVLLEKWYPPVPIRQEVLCLTPPTNN